MARMFRTVIAATAIGLFASVSVSASLGGSVATVEADRVRMRSALVRINRTDAYSVHELQAPTGTLVREYYGANGVVFGVAWDGEWPPDLRQLFGDYFDGYQTSVVSQRRVRKARGFLAVEGGGVVVRALTHARSASGVAYVPALLPSGVTPGVVR